MRHKAALWSTTAILAFGSSVAAAWEIEPSITLSQTYTSNVNLAPSDEEESDWVTRVLPEVGLLFEGNRLRAEANYQLEALFYADDSDRNEVYNHLDADVLANLIGEELQLRGRSYLSQVTVSPELPVSSSNIPVTGNRTDAFIWDVGPEWRRGVFGHSETEGHFRVGQVLFDDTPRTDDQTISEPLDIQDIDTIDGAAYLRSQDESPRPLRYELAYEYESVDYETSGELVQQSTWLRLGYQTTPAWQVFGLVGLDSDFQDPEDDSLNEGRWETGVAMATETTMLEAAVGHRYFGTTWRMLGELVEEDVRYRLSYDETPTTTDLTELRRLPAGVPGQEQPPLPPGSQLGRTGSGNFYLYKRADASVLRELYRSRATLGLFWERREDNMAFDPDTAQVQNLDDETAWGVYTDLGWDIGALTTASLNAAWENREYNNTLDDTAPAFEDDNLYLRMGVARELGLRTSASLYTGWSSRDRKDGSSADYDEYWVSVELVRTF